MRHPSSLDLEAFACGDPVPGVGPHLTTCAACRTYVERARELAAAAEPGARAVTPKAVPASSSRRRVVVGLAAALPTAAAMLLWITHEGSDALRPTNLDPRASAGSTNGATLPATLPTALPTPSSTRFKGHLQLAVIRERDGRQERFTGSVPVRPGDHLRFEVAVDEPRELVAGVLADDGTFVEVMAPRERASGAHLAERALKVDDRAGSGYAIAGPKQAVDMARRSGDFAGVETLSLVWEAATSPREGGR